MAAARKNYKKKTSKRSAKSDRGVMSTVITVRISDDEKERIDEIMMNLDIKRYSDVMRMALHMIRPDIGYIRVNMP
jgi:HSP90 family molecular chaperone